MRKTILSAILCIIILGMMSCNEERMPELCSDESEYIHNEEDGYIGTFSYDRYIEYSQNGGFQIDSNKFNNTTETEIKTKNDVIRLAQNELIREYNLIDVSYDELNSMWAIFTSIDYTSGQDIFIDSQGITKLILTTAPTYIGDSDIVFFWYNDYVRWFEEFEVNDEYKRYGTIIDDPNKFKNTMETELTTKEKAIELAKNEIDQTKEYDKITVYYDESNSMWMVSFWLYGRPYKGQYVFINNTGITELVIYGE